MGIFMENLMKKKKKEQNKFFCLVKVLYLKYSVT